jgi:3-deoxy-manno-octulosonate cytidylyltransferase (CMP-KDO synthetase)
MSSAIFIPCHLKSIRFPNKVLTKIFKLEMIEHVRRRALLSNIKNVHIVTNSSKISSLIFKNKGSAILTKKKHTDGSSRVNEISSKLDYEKIILLQGDEPLIYPSYLTKLNKACINTKNTVYNLGSRCKEDEIYDQNIVKCIVNSKMYVKKLFRDPSEIRNNEFQSIYKILGTILYPKNILNHIHITPPLLNKIEKKKSIEQIKILKSGYKLKIVLVSKSTQSINSINDKKLVIKELKKSKLQKKIFNKIV